MSEQPEAPRIEFPCDYPMKVIGAALDDMEDRVFEILSRHVETVDRSTFDLRPSRNGRFVSLRVVIRAEGEEHIQRMFADLKTLPGIQMVL